MIDNLILSTFVLSKRGHFPTIQIMLNNYSP